MSAISVRRELRRQCYLWYAYQSRRWHATQTLCWETGGSDAVRSRLPACVVQTYGERIDKIEIALGDTARYVSDGQASKLSQAIKVIALELGKRSCRNEFGGVYGELYRRFDITGYKLLPAAKFEDAMQFLKSWYESLTDNTSTILARTST